MKALEIKLNVVIEILETKEKKINNIVDYLKESKSELIDLHRQYYGKSEYELMDLHIEKAFNKSFKEIKKDLKVNKQMT